MQSGHLRARCANSPRRKISAYPGHAGRSVPLFPARRARGDVRAVTPKSVTPALAPQAFADGAGDARRVGGGRNDALVRHAAGDLKQELGARSLLELLTV